jgi:glycosyltransferase
MVAAAAAMVDDLVAFARDWAPDVVVYDSYSYAGPVAAAAVGVPGVRHLGGPDSGLRLEVIQPGSEPLPEYVELFERFGLPVPADLPSIVDPTPPSMRTVALPRLLGMRYVPHNGPGIAPEGLTGQRKRPRVLVTWGHSIPEGVGAAGAHPFREAIDAIAELGMDSVIAAAPAEVEQLGPLPDSTRALASVPLHLVLPYCDAIVHQGGYGTALTAATEAVPQLAIARTPETDMCASAVVAVGAGIHLRVPDLRDDPASQATIGNAMDQLLSDPVYAGGAAKLRAEIESQPAPADVAATLVAQDGRASLGG